VKVVREMVAWEKEVQGMVVVGWVAWEKVVQVMVAGVKEVQVMEVVG
jgi:hypothetical protein